MITEDQLKVLLKKYKSNGATIFREYLQVWFLSRLYTFPESKNIFFKGGTAIHLLFGAPRFSEDLDFTVEMELKKFLLFIQSFFEKISREEEISFKERETIAGKRFLLTAEPKILSYKVYVNLDFSFREKVLVPQKTTVKSEYPVLFTSFVYHLSKEEIFAEKIRAVMSRDKGRDIYDLWYLLSLGTSIGDKLIKEKLKYYQLENIKREEIINKIKKFSKKDFIEDLRPYVSLDQREKLGDLFDYIISFLQKSL